MSRDKRSGRVWRASSVPGTMLHVLYAAHPRKPPGDVEARALTTPSLQTRGGTQKWNCVPARRRPCLAFWPQSGLRAEHRPAGCQSGRHEGGCGKEPLKSRHLPGSMAGWRRLELPVRFSVWAQKAAIQAVGRGGFGGQERDRAPGTLPSLGLLLHLVRLTRVSFPRATCSLQGGVSLHASGWETGVWRFPCFMACAACLFEDGLSLGALSVSGRLCVTSSGKSSGGRGEESCPREPAPCQCEEAGKSQGRGVLHFTSADLGTVPKAQ